ncbi:MAG TPA: zf-TFIIB domain-containing protein [Pyrinomonadaceae bacterium]|jgi:Zn-finger nucleic acid-binding protein|nr:zf-TFIIB domain-containing protein [Pyrinomonadaceae bacterium]
MPIELDDRGRALENEYFHRKEKELLEKLRAKLAEEEARKLALKCPKCDGMLVESNLDAVVVDVCDKCNGIWLDPGELAQIVAKEDDGKGWFKSIFG